MGPIGSKVIEVKGQIYVFICLFPFSQVLGPIFTKLGGKVEGGPEGSNLVKGQGHRGTNNLSNVCLFVCSPTSPRSLGRSSPNFEGRWRAAPDISLRGSFLKGQGHRGQRSNLCFFFEIVCVCVCVCMCVSYLSSSLQSSYCYVETGKIYLYT